MIDILESKVVGTNKETWYKLIGTPEDTKPTGEFPAGTGHTVAKDSTIFEIGTQIRYEFDGTVWAPKGQVDIKLIEKTITENGTYVPADDDADGYSSVTANVPNTYTAGDEGKVVDNGELVAQTARAESIAANGTYDTTKNNSVTVDVVSTIKSVDTLPSSYQANLTGIELIEKINIPEELGVTTLNTAAFKAYPNLKEITIPSTVTSIGSGTSNVQAFALCDNLEKIIINKPENSIPGYEWRWGASVTTQIIWTG